MTDEVTPAHDVAATLAARMPDLVAGTSLRVGDEVFPTVAAGTSARMVAVRNTAGGDLVPFHGVDDGRGEETAFVMVRAREDKNDPRGLEALATRIVDALEIRPPDGWFECRIVGGGPNRLGPSAEGYPEASVNVRLRRDTRWLPIFYGPAVDPGPGGYDAAFVAALAGTDPKTRRRFTYFSTTIGAGAKLFLVLPSKYGTPQVRHATTKAAIAGAVVDSVTLTLPHGGETFLVWASTATALGLLPVSVL